MAEIAEFLGAEIETRNKLKAQMVGSLYPRILQDEINTLFQARGLIRAKTGLGKTQCGPGDSNG
jgi:hypothetical protein